MEIFGLPVHPLVIHFVVVGIPAVVLVALAYIVRPTWRRALSIPLLVLTILTVASTALAAESGDALSDQVDESSALSTHEDLGEQTEIIVALFGLSIIAMLGLEWYQRRQQGQSNSTPSRALSQGLVAVMVGVVLLGAVATVWDVRAGHAGAKAVWSDTAAADGGEAEGGENEGEENEGDSSFLVLPTP